MKHFSLIVLCVLVAGCGVKPSCEQLREDVFNAKARRGQALTAGDSVLAEHYRAELEKAAKTARAAGCGLDDLIGPNVGR